MGADFSLKPRLELGRTAQQEPFPLDRGQLVEPDEINIYGVAAYQRTPFVLGIPVTRGSRSQA